jgi:predicted glycosyltransferase
MKILVEIGHPAHVHFFKYPIAAWQKQGHKVAVVSRDKEMAVPLLYAYGIKNTCLSKAGRGAAGLLCEMLKRDLRLWILGRRFKPDIMTSIGGTWISHVSKAIRKPAVVFYDTENAVFSNAITYPFVAALCTPRCYQARTNLGKRHLRYPGYHELAYLHPRRFQPDPGILRLYGLSPFDSYFVVRFIAWTAGHDLKERGLALEDKLRLVEMLSRLGRVFVSSESPLPPQLERLALPVPPEHIHHVLAFAKMAVGESATMASEAAMLGVPAIFISDIGRGYTMELEKRYGLVCHYTTQQIEKSLNKVKRLLCQPNLREQWREKRTAMLSETIDVSAFVTKFVQDYPESLVHYWRQWADLQQAPVEPQA